MRTKLIRTMLAALAATLVACGSSAKTAVLPAPTTTTVPEVTRIVSLSPTATEMLFAIGAGTQVVAVDDQSNYPENAPRTNLSGYQPNVEAIAAKNPDLVVVSDGSVKPQLEKLGIRVLVEPAASTLDDVYNQLDAVGSSRVDLQACKLEYSIVSPK